MNNKNPEVESDTSANNLCKRGCGFYGSVQFKDMCSKCYQEFLKSDKAAQAPTSKSVAEAYSSLSSGLSSQQSILNGLDLLKPSSSPRSCQLGKRKLESVDFLESPPEPVSEKNNSTISGSLPSSKQTPLPRTVNRCQSCRKRVGLTGFHCRCDGLFCALHRYSDQHTCPFDYRKQGKMEIARDNPEVRCAKIRKI